MKILDDKFDCYESREVCRLSASYLAAVRELEVAERLRARAGEGFEGQRLRVETVYHEAAAKVCRLQGAWIRAIDAFEAAVAAEEPRP
jgi:hypothetical protein